MQTLRHKMRDHHISFPSGRIRFDMACTVAVVIARDGAQVPRGCWSAEGRVSGSGSGRFRSRTSARDSDGSSAVDAGLRYCTSRLPYLRVVVENNGDSKDSGFNPEMSSVEDLSKPWRVKGVEEAGMGPGDYWIRVEDGRQRKGQEVEEASEACEP